MCLSTQPCYSFPLNLPRIPPHPPTSSDHIIISGVFTTVIDSTPTSFSHSIHTYALPLPLLSFVRNMEVHFFKSCLTVCKKLRGKTCEISSWVVTVSDRQKVDTWGGRAKPQQFTLVCIQCPKTLYWCWMNPVASCFWTSIYHPHCVYPLSDVTQCPLYIMRSPRPSPSIAAARLSGIPQVQRFFFRHVTCTVVCSWSGLPHA